MPTDPTPERVREWAGFLNRNTRVLPGKEFAGDWIAVPEEDFVAARIRLDALARQVIALREIVLDYQIAAEVLAGEDADTDPVIISLRARLDAISND